MESQLKMKVKPEGVAVSRCSWSPFSFQGHLPRCQGGGVGDGVQEAGLECAGLEAPDTRRVGQEGGRVIPHAF